VLKKAVRDACQKAPEVIQKGFFLMTKKKFFVAVAASFVIGVLHLWMGVTFQHSMRSYFSPRSYTMRPLQSHLSLDASEADSMDNWPILQQALCGEGYPNTVLSRVLFQQARKEVFGNVNNNQTEHNLDPAVINRINNLDASHNPSKLLSLFYKGSFGTRVYYSKKRHLATIYVRMWKCGNNQIRAMEDKMWGRENVQGLKMTDAIYAVFTKNKTDGTHIPKHHKQQSCIYTAVRDPISHFLSGYNEVMFRILVEGDEPSQYNNSVSFSKAEELRRVHFQQLVKDVLLEFEYLAIKLYTHFFAMSRVISSLHMFNLSLTGYIPSLANLTSTWPQFMSSTCPGYPSLEQIPHMEVMRQHKSSNDEFGFYQAAKNTWNEGGDIARALCIIHAFDYACFEDLPDGIPSLCRDVYGSPSFVKTILEAAATNEYSG
jgi:hypothetical protein